MKLTSPIAMGVRTYQDAVKKLNSLQSNYATIMAIRQSGNSKNKMAILEMQEWTKRIGYSISDLDNLNMIHITGTKGKGSTAAFTDSILSQYRDSLPKIGLFTSPHLKSVRERIRINSEPIDEMKFTKYFFEVWDKLESTQSSTEKFPNMIKGAKPAYFKYLTLLSFHIFLQEGVKGCIYEVGVGGEYDSTNIVSKPVTCGVSLLGIDHTFMLGNTIEEIAWNKGGIFKTNAPAYTISNQPQAGLQVLHERAKERSTTLTVLPNFFQLENIKLGIDGKFQLANASLAVGLSSQFLSKMEIENIKPISARDATIPAKFIKGLKASRWEGRCQTLKENGRNWYIDGAHTADSINAASEWFKDIAIKSPNKKVLLFNQQARDAKALVNYIHEKLYPEIQFDEVIFTSNVTWKSGAYSSDLVSMNEAKEEVDMLTVQKALAEEWKSFDDKSKVHVSSDIESAYELIDNLKINSNEIDIFVTGSLHLVGGLLVVFDGK
ncbi:hypothetical protein TPHA_0G01620 [Tetrapisispora phaffii CBS 4417]|uniref:Folylpolyglutamate synthase n=1 Tax=Tetrapisispora phaffii (strain ATCC 24235 / CBS 4417 / NBRC 1672 / NRRL Y-8282 / UCD 70-5) TaxID=1071381 RepID=G8BVS0_TETPH|nr:hypothetical protein TPHA_0G01620 [Tetrapisispora phaffii CBS 4417]CCE63998.1 hypothetical protein TPHA_0G01620 [Tetrapisispora phaffii CBS 4417]